VIPDPVPAELASLTPEQIQAIDDGWLACTTTLPIGTWTAADMQDCLVAQLGVPPDDPGLLVFLQWATLEGLVPEPAPPVETTTSTP
jgi:hypothetical protein